MAVTTSEFHPTVRTNGTNKKVLMLYAGGIVDYSEPGNMKSPLRPVDFKETLDRLSGDLEVYKSHGIDVVSESYEPIVSTNFGITDWKEIASRVYSHKDIDGTVIIHGADVMDYTASALSFMLENLRMPVVLAGGFTPISKTKPKAREDIAAAVSIAAGLDVSGEKKVPKIPEVCIYTRRMGNSNDSGLETVKLLRGNRAIQYDTDGGFDSPNYPALCEDDFFFYPENILPMPSESEAASLFTGFDDRITLLGWDKNVLGETITRRAIESYLSCDPKAVVVNSVLSSESRKVPNILKILYEAKDPNVPVILASNIKNGVVLSEELKRELDKMGMTSAGDMTVPAAYTKTSYLLGKGRIDLMTRNLRGEIGGPLVRKFD